MALGKPVALVGVRSNIFHRLPTVQVYSGAGDISTFLRQVLDE